VNSATEPADLVLANRYGEAWNAHRARRDHRDAGRRDRVRAELAGYPLARRAGDVAEQFRFFLAAIPDMHFATQSLRVAEAFFVHQFRFTATLAAAFPLVGQRVDVDGVDVITTSAGLVASKHTYMDAFALRSQLGLGELTAAAG
jgi:SnoaL-like polyketide cyclase